MELLSPACVDRGWRVEYTQGETWFVAPNARLVLPQVTWFTTVQDAEHFEEKRTRRALKTANECFKQMKETIAASENAAKRHRPTAEERRALWMTNAKEHAPALKVGDDVDVMRRKWPGINKEGGRARITSIHAPIVRKKKKNKLC